MRPEQLPENKGGRPPPENAWLLREGEMQTSEIRSLGYLFYATVFTRLLKSVVSATRKEHQKLAQKESLEDTPSLLTTPRQQFPPQFDVRIVPAEAYVNAFAKVYGFNTVVLKRWTHQTSIELANSMIPLLSAEGAEPDRSQEEQEEFQTNIVQPIVDVATLGLQSSVENHMYLAAEAFYTGRNLSRMAPASQSLIGTLLGELEYIGMVVK